MSEEDLYTLEIGSVVSDNKLGARSGAPSMSAPDLYAADNGGPQNPARQKMVALRVTLLRLHKTLLDMERREYEPGCTIFRSLSCAWTKRCPPRKP